MSGNCRGIMFMNTLTKVYDTLLLNRLTQWVSTDRYQARAQEERGCLEQLMALRLVCDCRIRE